MTDWINSILTDDARERLGDLPESSVHCMMASPPYWQLRDYGGGTVSVWGGKSDCEHDWQPAGTVRRGGQNTDENPPDVGGNSHAQDTGIRGSGCGAPYERDVERTCDCDTEISVSGIALDPFAGAGTTCLKAKELGRRFAGIELNPEYADMARTRIGLTPDEPSRVRVDDSQQGLEAFTDLGGADD